MAASGASAFNCHSVSAAQKHCCQMRRQPLYDTVRRACSYLSIATHVSAASGRGVSSRQLCGTGTGPQQQGSSWTCGEERNAPGRARCREETPPPLTLRATDALREHPPCCGCESRRPAPTPKPQPANKPGGSPRTPPASTSNNDPANVSFPRSSPFAAEVTNIRSKSRPRKRDASNLRRRQSNLSIQFRGRRPPTDS